MWQARPDGLYVWGQVVNPAQPDRRRVLWWRVDTGATWTTVDPRILAACGCLPIGTTVVVGATGGPVRVPVYRVTLLLPPAVARPDVRVIGLPLPAVAYEGLLGDNVLRTLSLVWQGPRGRWTLMP